MGAAGDRTVHRPGSQRADLSGVSYTIVAQHWEAPGFPVTLRAVCSNGAKSDMEPSEIASLIEAGFGDAVVRVASDDNTKAADYLNDIAKHRPMI